MRFGLGLIDYTSIEYPQIGVVVHAFLLSRPHYRNVTARSGALRGMVTQRPRYLATIRRS